MKKIIQIYLLFAAIVLSATSCVKDGGSPCPNYLKIVYNYNMEFVDLFHREVSFFSIFMFDAQTGVLVREVKQTQHPFPENYTMLVPEEWFDQKYDIVVWAGLDDGSYNFSELTPGISTIDDFQLKVKDYENQLVDRNTELEPLWHGMLRDVFFSDLEETTYTISLRKDTRKFRLVLQVLGQSTTVDVNDLDISILSADGWYDNNNQVLDQPNREITYLPYYTANDPEVGAIAEMNSLRLMNDERTNKLLITDKSTNRVILDMPLISYLNALRLLQYEKMPLQEYLDREDEYYILVFLQAKEESWLAVQISINDWIIRTQDVN
ncbi:FimB/Mfa2 family fimbrial subunit [Bacteroides sp. 519]|uniref:FimB/Mfa2 family fimbrial subunit n=1 Tax=Bacteroides sp. 519 TaxID=2302937 RepID=UPI0013D52D93|nr:FimB/Mfa2 family fimbrial subunit [Bacteroides sp. 519]NDV56947.1 hypothetical protein [Bacteroides sp. 519]